MGTWLLVGFASAALLVGCAGQDPGGGRCDDVRDGAPLRINELTADNEGNWIDEIGQLGDWVELVNPSDTPVDLSDYSLSDAQAQPQPLPERILAPRGRTLLWLDDEPGRGASHLPFKLDADGDELSLWFDGCEVDTVRWADLQQNETLARHPDGQGELASCRYATPTVDNGAQCGPAPRPEPELREYQPFSWPQPFPSAAGSVVINELALRPAGYLELLNVGDEALDAASLAVEIAPHAPGQAWPVLGEGQPVALGAPDSLEPDAPWAVSVDSAALAQVAADPAFEGVLSVFDVDSGALHDRVDFMRWPEGAVLVRRPDAPGTLVFCEAGSEGEPNEPCAPLPSRDVGDRLRHLRTDDDFRALAAGDVRQAMEAVKVIVDMDAGDVVHFPGATDWPLHYQFVRELIDGEAPLDRCNPQQARAFDQGWWRFTQEQYLVSDTRRYLLGTLISHGPSGLHTLEFSAGDLIAAAQIERAFFAVTAHLPNPHAWAFRPQGERQRDFADELEGRLPIVDEQAPFAGLQYQPLSQTVGFGVLEIVTSAELDAATLGPRTIVVTDDVPNDIPLVGGLITEAFQTPLSHVNILSQSRDTPNMALADALQDPRILDHVGELVRLQVSGAEFTLEPADPLQAEAFWQAREPAGPLLEPALDPGPRGLIELTDADFSSLPVIGAKAAQLAELYRIPEPGGCGFHAHLPAASFALPVVHSIEHLSDSGGLALLEELWADPQRSADPVARREVLAQVRDAIRAHPVAPAVLAELEDTIAEAFGPIRVRLRSSSNTEDLPGFNGAGLYDSVSVDVSDPDRSVQDGLRKVWASLWNERAYDERELARIDHRKVAMGVLVHQAFRNERANGVGVSRNVLDPIRGDIMYLNAQAGEASVTNPAPGVQTEELVWRGTRTPEVIRTGFSSLTDGADVLRLDEIRHITCMLAAMRNHFRPLIDPAGQDRLFAIETEFKLLGPERQLLVKQARPHPFESVTLPADCREFN